MMLLPGVTAARNRPLKRRNALIREGLPPAPMICRIARPHVAVPCRMISGSPADLAKARSVWIGYQILAH